MQEKDSLILHLFCIKDDMFVKQNLARNKTMLKVDKSGTYINQGEGLSRPER